MQDQLNEVFSRHKGERNELIPILQEIQEAVGYLPREAMAATAKFLGISESTVYGVSLERVACFGSCALAPVMVVDDKVYGNVSPEQALDILKEYE